MTVDDYSHPQPLENLLMNVQLIVDTSNNTRGNFGFTTLFLVIIS